MSKRALTKYLQELPKEELELQILDLYNRLKEVKTFYDFVFNPKEEKLFEDAKLKIALEYFPAGRRKRAKMRRTVASKLIKHFVQLGADPVRILDLMLFHIQTAQAYSLERPIYLESFYKAMLKSFEDALEFARANGIELDFKNRFEGIMKEAIDQDWINAEGFERVLMPKAIRSEF
ncbi:MAG: hypothetical protein KDC83_06080 [Flavobacteriales bacterium]|nr:hypothetical protein [Flavobacteriales bacterium]